MGSIWCIREYLIVDPPGFAKGGIENESSCYQNYRNIGRNRKRSATAQRKHGAVVSKGTQLKIGPYLRNIKGAHIRGSKRLPSSKQESKLLDYGRR